MSQNEVAEIRIQERTALAAAWPRPLIANGSATRLAAWWVGSRQAAIDRGQPPIARHSLTRPLRQGLFDARRARQLARGLDAADSMLAGEAAGLRKAAAGRPGEDVVRISRLLLVSADGSERFYRQVAKLGQVFANRLAILLLDCDEEALGAAAFGSGKRARALLIHHKDSVVRLLSRLDVEADGLGRDAPKER